MQINSLSSPNHSNYYALLCLVVGLLVNTVALANRPIAKVERYQSSYALEDGLIREVNAFAQKIIEPYQAYLVNAAAFYQDAKQDKTGCIWKAGEINVANSSFGAHRSVDRHKLEVKGAEPNQTLNSDFSLLQGRSVRAVVNTRSDHELTGHISARVMEEVSAEKSNIVLIPSSSSLRGTYHHVIEQGQVRVYVIWTHILAIHPTSFGSSHRTVLAIELLSPGASAVAKAGSLGKVNKHFCKYLSEALLISRIDGMFEPRTMSLADKQALRLGLCHYQGQQLPKTAKIHSVFHSTLPNYPLLSVQVQRSLVFPQGDVYSKTRDFYNVPNSARLDLIQKENECSIMIRYMPNIPNENSWRSDD